MTTVDASLRCQILSAWLANETRTTTLRALRVTDDLYREVLADAGCLDDKGLTEGGAVTHLGRWVLRVCADRHLDATFELTSSAGAVVVGPVAS